MTAFAEDRKGLTTQAVARPLGYSVIAMPMRTIRYDTKLYTGCAKKLHTHLFHSMVLITITVLGVLR